MSDNDDFSAKAYVQVYTGDGKGKSTAAFGLAFRAAGAGFPVFIAQFAKSGDYSEIKALKRFSDLVTIRQFGKGCFIHNTPSDEDRSAARNGLCEIREILQKGEHKLVIMDEANIATFYELISVDELLELIEIKAEHVELVITGRKADPRLIDRADLVTEMREIKHYYTQGVQARIGIEK